MRKPTGKPTNLYLNPRLVRAATKLAATRYECSLSTLVEKLLSRKVRDNT